MRQSARRSHGSIGRSVALAAVMTLLFAACAAAPETSEPSPSPSTSPSSVEGFTREIAPFPVRGPTGDEYAHPFLGGLDVPRPQFVDIDGDGDADLFVQERSDAVMFFENVGSASAARYVWRTDRFHELSIGEWSRFLDIDHDGDFDLLAERPYSYVRLYRNVGDARAPRFEVAADSVKDIAGTPIFSDRQNIPFLIDLDCDRNLDLFLGRVDGTVTRYEQAATEAGVPRFAHVTDRFENIEIVGQLAGSARHGANSMVFADRDGDGDADLFWGDFFEPGLLLIENTGSCASPSLRSQPQPLRANGDTIVTSGFNAAALPDIDADGDLDLFIGVLGGAFNPNRTASENFYFYEQGAAGELTLRTRRFLDGIDVGSESVPALGDIDGDGDLDLLVAPKIDPLELTTSRLYVFTNTGSATAPAYQLADTLALATSYHYAPALADLDDDGLLDLVLGTWNDGVQFYPNRGTPQRPDWRQDTTATIRLTRGSNAIPALGDIDGDGDFDLFVGESSGEVNFYRNEGSRTAPRFTLVADTYESMDAGRRSHPALADVDGDGDLDLLLGSEAGTSTFYRNDGSRTAPRFMRDENGFGPPLLPNSAPAFADIDGDARLDLIVGNLSGGLVFWRGR
jgi:FG-GAP-like repeat